jgi:hypothetical protein
MEYTIGYYSTKVVVSSRKMVNGGLGMLRGRSIYGVRAECKKGTLQAGHPLIF